MLRKNLLVYGLASAGALTVTAALFWPRSKEEVIISQLQGLAAASSFSQPIENPIFFGSALTERWEDYLNNPVRVTVPEVQSRLPSQPGQLAMSAALVLSRFGAFQVSLSDLEVRLTALGASVDGVAEVTVIEAGTPRRDTRPVHFELSEDGGQYLVTTISVSDHADEP